MKSAELREQHNKLIAEARAAYDNVDKKYSDAEANAKFDEIFDEAAKVEQSYQRALKLEEADKAREEYERHMNASAGRKTSPEIAAVNNEVTNVDKLTAVQGMIRSWVKGDMRSVLRPTEEHIRAMQKVGFDPNSDHFIVNLNANAPRSHKRSYELNERALATTTGAMIPTTIEQRIEQALLQYGPLRDFATVIRTNTGGPYTLPTCNDSSNKGALLAENTQIALQDPTYSSKSIPTYKFSSKGIKVSVEMLQDNVVNLEQQIVESLGTRISRIENEYFTTGAGSTVPEGVVTGSASGVTLASASAITFDEIKDLFYSVDPDYRDNPSCAFMMNDSTWKAVAKIKNSAGQYMVQLDVTGREVKSLLGCPVFTNREVAAFGAANKVMVFGAFDKFVIRDAGDVVFMRLNELYADYHTIGFLAFHRAGSVVLNAGTNPLKYAVCP